MLDGDYEPDIHGSAHLQILARVTLGLDRLGLPGLDPGEILRPNMEERFTGQYVCPGVARPEHEHGVAVPHIAFSRDVQHHLHTQSRSMGVHRGRLVL